MEHLVENQPVQGCAKAMRRLQSTMCIISTDSELFPNQIVQKCSLISESHQFVLDLIWWGIIH